MFNWCLRLSNGYEIRFKSMMDAIKHAEDNKLHDCVVEGPALSEAAIMNEIKQVEAAGFNISADCFLANFDGKLN